jgi:predicted ABC-type ATPase
LRATGWHVALIYLALPSTEMSRLQVAERVAHGGHYIPARDIARRFSRSLGNLMNEFSIAVNTCRCFIHSGTFPELVFEQWGDRHSIVHPEHYQLLLQESSL